MKRFVLCLLFLTLAACATLQQPRPGTLLAAAPVGATLTLPTALEVPANSARVFIQGARTVSYWDLDEYYPHCVLQLSRVSDAPQTVVPDRFTVTRSFDDTDRLAARPVQLAGLTLGAADGLGSPSSTVLFLTRMLLSSPNQPDVMYLECAQRADYSVGDYLTRKEFETAVGAIFRLG